MQKSIQSIKRKNNIYSLMFKKLMCLNAKYCDVKACPRHEKKHKHLKHIWDYQPFTLWCFIQNVIDDASCFRYCMQIARRSAFESFLSHNFLSPVFVSNPYCDGWSSESQAEQHQKGDDLMVGIDVGEAQAAVMAVESRLHRLKHICPLQEVQTDHRRHQDWQLSTDTTEDRKKKISDIS